MSGDNKVVYVGDDSDDEEENKLIYDEPSKAVDETNDTEESGSKSVSDDASTELITSETKDDPDSELVEDTVKSSAESESDQIDEKEIEIPLGDSSADANGEEDADEQNGETETEVEDGEEVGEEDDDEENGEADENDVKEDKEEVDQEVDQEEEHGQDGGDKYDDPGDSVSSVGDDEEDESSDDGSDVSLDTEAILNVDPLYYRLTKFLQCGGESEGEPKQNVAQILFQINNNLVKMNQLFESYLEKN